MATILDLPLEILVEILSYLRLNLQGLMELASVCHRFRSAVFCCPIPVRLPLSEQQLVLMRCYKIPVNNLCNVQPSMYVSDQLSRLNLQRLTEAQLVANDYLSKSKKTVLSPQYWTLLKYLYPCYILKVLMLNVDLSKTIACDRQAVFKSAEFCGQFINLTFLSLHFTPQIELNERLEGTESSQKFIQEKFINTILKKLPKLKKLYLHACPIQHLVIKSNTLEKLCIYRSEFLDIKEIHAPKLKTLMFHEGLRQFFKHFEAKKMSNSNTRPEYDVFEVIYDGCPKLHIFNSVPVGNLHHFYRGKKEWCLAALSLCLKSYQKLFNSGADALQIQLG